MGISAFLPAALLALGSGTPALAGGGQVLPVAAVTGADAAAFSPAVARVVQSLVEYTSWPTPRSPVRLCVAGAAQFDDRLDGLRLANGRTIDRRQAGNNAASLSGCDAVYMGQLTLAQQREITSALRGRGVLTIAEADPECRSHAMFCLSYATRAVSFRLNVDAVARSGLRVDPRVLRLAAGQP
jgi:hypothetical protein